MPVTTKRFYAATLIEIAGCSAETFRSWRTRNGLFPETQGSGTWNKFSIIDMCVAWIVAALTSRGMTAQAAIDSAVAAGPVLAELCDYGDEVDENDLPGIIWEIMMRIAERNAVLAFALNDQPGPKRTVVKLIDKKGPIEDALHLDLSAVSPFSIVLNVAYLMGVVGRILLKDVDIEGADGEKVRWIGQFSDLRRAEAMSSPSMQRPRTGGANGKRRTVRKS